MSTSQIKFGTDGWRAIIADQYTFENVARVAQATGQWLKKMDSADGSVVIGYDTRFGGSDFAKTTAQVLGSMGIRVHLAESFTTTPAVSLATKKFGCDAGIVITASHNPPRYNGFKIKSSFGGPASPEQIAEVEAELDQITPGLELKPVAELEDVGLIRRHHLTTVYVDEIMKSLDIDAIKNAGLVLAYDSMFGAGQGVLDLLLGSDNLHQLHNYRNPGFDGQAPEPIERNLSGLRGLVLVEECDLGLATDGDADRIGLFDELGNFVDSHKILALLVKYLHQEQGQSGEIVKTFSTTSMLDKMGEAYGLPVVTTPIGFKYIGPRIVEEDVLVGGEESGGMAVKGHIPERDGIYIGLLVAEMIVKRGKPLSALVNELTEEFGSHVCAREDLHTTEERKLEFLEQLKTKGLASVNGSPVARKEDMDGYKFYLEDGSWAMVRPSGTEPVLRVYAEAADAETATAMVASVTKQV